MERTIDVSANLSTQVAPDTIEFKIDITGICDIRDNCTTKYNAIFEAMKKALELNGLSSSILKNKKYSISPREVHEYQKKGSDRYFLSHTKIEGYNFHASLSITQPLKDGLIEKIWQALSSCGDGVTFSMEYSIANKDAIKDRLSSNAIVTCREKADILARAAGVKVIGLQNAHYEYESIDFGESLGARYARETVDVNDDAPIFNPLEIKISCYVSTTWDIELLPPDDLL